MLKSKSKYNVQGVPLVINQLGDSRRKNIKILEILHAKICKNLFTKASVLSRNSSLKINYIWITTLIFFYQIIFDFWEIWSRANFEELSTLYNKYPHWFPNQIFDETADKNKDPPLSAKDNYNYNTV